MFRGNPVLPKWQFLASCYSCPAVSTPSRAVRKLRSLALRNVSPSTPTLIPPASQVAHRGKWQNTSPKYWEQARTTSTRWMLSASTVTWEMFAITLSLISWKRTGCVAEHADAPSSLNHVLENGEQSQYSRDKARTRIRADVFALYGLRHLFDFGLSSSQQVWVVSISAAVQLSRGALIFNCHPSEHVHSGDYGSQCLWQFLESSK